MSRSDKWGCLISYLIHSLVFYHVVEIHKWINKSCIRTDAQIKRMLFFFWGGFPAEVSNRHPLSQMRPWNLKSRKRDEETSRPVTCCRKQQRYTHQNKEAGSEPDGWEHSHPDTAALKRNSTLPDSLHHVPPPAARPESNPPAAYLWKELYSPMNSQLHPGKWVWRSLNILL